MPRLTDEERELCVWYADGVTIGQIADWRNCSRATAKRAIADVRKTLSVSGLELQRLLGPPIKKIRSLHPFTLASL
jgi:hypothetical protein